MICSVEFSALPMAKQIAERTPMVEAASVKASCSLMDLIDLGFVLRSHSGLAGVRVLEPRLGVAIHQTHAVHNC